MTDVIFAWSGGKDGMLALDEVVRAGEFRVAALLTNVTRDFDRVSIHGVRRALLEEQAAALGLPLHTVELSANSSNDEYGARMREALSPFHARGIDTVAHGDIFLADVRAYREALLAGIGMRALFPLWGADTGELAERFLGLGYRAVLTCVDTHAIDGAFAGRAYDAALLRDLPEGADPCGENGEFHTFVWDGPLFARPVGHTLGETVLRDERFTYRDLVPARPPGASPG
jgi:uncharacterized protein (TIGR00290 family)